MFNCSQKVPSSSGVSKAVSLKGLVVFRDFDINQIIKQRSKESREKPILSPGVSQWGTTTGYGEGGEVEEGVETMAGLQENKVQGFCGRATPGDAPCRLQARRDHEGNAQMVGWRLVGFL